MCHWQWLLLVITIFFVVSNGGERINRRRSIHVGGNSKKRRETPNPEKISTNVIFPLWVTIGGMGSIGGETEYKKIDNKLYEFTLPFLVLVKESDVCTNRSAKQDKHLAYPFWVRIVQVQRKYANQTVQGKVRLAFPFELEVAGMSIVGATIGIDPTPRTLTESALVGTVGLAATSVMVISTIVGAIVLTHVVKAAVQALWEGAVTLFRPSENSAAKTIVGAVAGGLAGVIVSFVPGLGDIVKVGIRRIFQVFGDTLVTFLKTLLSQHVFGDVMLGLNVAMYVMNSIPFTSWRIIHGNKTNQALRPPPEIITPPLAVAPRSDLKMICILKLGYGQETIPGYPDYLIVWPGRPEPRPTNSIIVRPIVPTLPLRPNIQLIWPLQSSYEARPNIVLILRGQRLIPGYVNVVIVWPGQRVPDDEDLILLRPPQEKIHSILGVRFIWPGIPPSHGPYLIHLQEQQRQHPRFPTIVFVYPGDLLPPRLPGITVVFSPSPGNSQQSVIPDYAGITIIWPEVPAPTTEVTSYTLPQSTSYTHYASDSAPGSEGSIYTTPGKGAYTSSPAPPIDNMEDTTYTTPGQGAYTSPPTAPIDNMEDTTYTTPGQGAYTSPPTAPIDNMEDTTYTTPGQGAYTSPPTAPIDNMEDTTYTTPGQGAYTSPPTAPIDNTGNQNYTTPGQEAYTYPTAAPEDNTEDKTYTTPGQGAYTSPHVAPEVTINSTPGQGRHTSVNPSPGNINNPSTKGSISQLPSNIRENITIGPDDMQVPGYPNIMIIYPGRPKLEPMSGIVLINYGQTTIPEYPHISLCWLPHKARITRITVTTIEIPPAFTEVPGYPQFSIDRSGRPGRRPLSVKPGDQTLPGVSNVLLIWLEIPTELALRPDLEVARSSFVYDVTYVDSKDTCCPRRSVGGGFLRMSDGH